MEPFQALVQLLALVLEHGLLRPQDRQALGPGGAATLAEAHEVLDALDGQAAFAKRLDQVQTVFQRKLRTFRDF